MDLKKLRPLDYLLCTSASIVAECIRIKEVGFWRMFDLNVATHVGAIVDVNGNFFIAEMMGNGYRIDPLADYLKTGWGKDRIVMVRRNPVYDNTTVRYNRNAQIIADANKCLKYDYAGIFEYVFPQIKDKKNEFYCSELYAHYAIEDGGKIDVSHKITDNDDLMPWDFQQAKNLSTIVV
jgi:hypothetical protein